MSYTEGGGDEEPAEPRGPTALRRAAQDGKRARAEADSLRRELTLLRAGVDVRTPLGGLFNAGYHGEITDEAVSAAWAMVAPPNGPTAEPLPPEPEWTEYERESTRERSALALGSPADQVPDIHPNVAADVAQARVVAAGGTEQDGMTARLETIVAAAINGDRRVIVQRDGLTG